MNYECIMDLEDKLPTIISNSGEVNQLLTNIFTLLQSEPQNSGGILIQTRVVNEQILLKLISTDYIPLLANYEENPSRDLSIMMITRFMEKHSGKVLMDTSPSGGSNISLLFPLKRKLQ